MTGELTGERRARIEELFLQVVELPPEVREDRLRDRCPDDPALAEEVLKLLEAHEGASLLDRLADQLGHGSLSNVEAEIGGLATTDGAIPLDESDGARVGPYRLHRLLGHGGMGAVYLAERVDGEFDQQVALKLHRSDLASPDARRRFLAERQILAGLSHPNIARLLDGGVTDDGRPYFGMEYVDGSPVDCYCDENRLDVEARLRMFVAICDAVQHAHRNLIVHRDLKPSNILVTPEGSVKLLDFGIAKLLEGEGTSRTDLTRTGVRVLTPDYASPEQVLGSPITTSSDVYQLGLILYELLSGRRAYRLATGSLEELERTLTATVVRPPSSVLAEDGPAQSVNAVPASPSIEQIARCRSTTPDSLRRRLSGDLDNIVLRAIRTEPERRYGSPSELADDIGRHLTGHPVRARPDTIVYRTSKFLRRNRIPVGALAGVFAMTAGFGLAMARQADRTARERDRAEEVTSFLENIFLSSDPEVVRGDTLTLLEVLDQGAERIRTELGADPELQAAMMATMARVYANLNLYDEGLAMRLEALAILERIHPPDHYEVANARVAAAIAHTERGEFGVASPLLEEGEEGLRGSGASGTDWPAGLTRLGWGWQAQGSVDRAQALYEEALAAYRKLDGPLEGEAITLSNLGLLQLVRDDPDSAEVFLRAGLGVRRSLHDPGHPSVARSLVSLAEALVVKGALDAADSALTEALGIQRKIYDPGHVALSGTLAATANLLGRKGAFEEAEQLYREALDSYGLTLGPDHPILAQVRNDFGAVLKESGNPVAAAELFSEALSGFEAHFGDDHLFTAVARSNLGSVLYQKGRLDEAESMLTIAVATMLEVRPGTPSTADALADLAEVRANLGDNEAALPLLYQALDIYLPTLGGADHRTLRVRNALGIVLAREGRYAEAEAQLDRTIEETSGRPQDQGYRAYAISVLVQIYDAWGKPKEAERVRALLGGAGG